MFQQLDALNLPKGSYAIFGSGPMFAHGLKELHDLDLLVTPEVFAEFSHKPGWTFREECDDLIQCGDLEMVATWKPGVWDIAKLIAEAEEIDGYPYVRLEEVLKWKKIRNKEKDLRDIEILEKYFAEITA